VRGDLWSSNYDYVYNDENWDDVLSLVDNTSPYALTGSIFSGDRYAIEDVTKRLSNVAGNFTSAISLLAQW
jgi:1-pyrroline-5-carboxylate dehydrogenase